MCNAVEHGVDSARLPSNPVGPFLKRRPQPVVGFVQSTTRLVPACLPAALSSKPMNGMKTIFYELRPAFPARRLRLQPEAAAAARSFRSWLMRSMKRRKATRRVRARSAFSGREVSPNRRPPSMRARPASTWGTDRDCRLRPTALMPNSKVQDTDLRLAARDCISWL